MPMYQARKRRVVEARQYSRIGHLAEEVANWCGGEQSDNGMVIPRGHIGPVFVYYGDWVVQDENGKFSVYPSEEFHATFEAI